MTLDYTNIALQIAIHDFDKFCMMAGVNMNKLKCCLERERGLSLQQISNKTGIKKSTVKFLTDQCLKK